MCFSVWDATNLHVKPKGPNPPPRFLPRFCLSEWPGLIKGGPVTWWWLLSGVRDLVKSQDPQAVVQRLMCPPSRKKTLAEVREVCSAAIFFWWWNGNKTWESSRHPPPNAPVYQPPESFKDWGTKMGKNKSWSEFTQLLKLFEGFYICIYFTIYSLNLFIAWSQKWLSSPKSFHITWWGGIWTLKKHTQKTKPQKLFGRLG